MRAVAALCVATFLVGCGSEQRRGDPPLRMLGARDDEHGSELRSAEVFDPRRNRWTAAGRMAAARYKITDAVARLPDGRVLVAGGAPAVEVFDPATLRFRTLLRTGAGPLFATATALPDGRTLVAGGYDGRIQPSAAAALIG